MNERKAGTVAIVGRPNVGKSTLLNRLIGEKISIVSRKAQTTRHRIMGILTRPDAQYVFVDTPGFQTRHVNALNRTMNRVVTQALAEVDVVVLVIDADRVDVNDQTVFNLLIHNCPVILAINKLDRLKDKARLLPMIANLAEQYSFAAIVPISAAKGSQLDVLLTEIRKLLPGSELLFDEDEITDKSERFLAAEFIREQLFRLTGDELPYAATVNVEKFELDGALRRINAVIVVDRSSHKGIIIGKHGETLKRIASEARLEMERLFDGKVFLEVFVQVKSGWNDDEQLLKSLGYE
ncbi:GTPase Era [Propionivibrio sp.]|uniref:GTPase Era n=1 Tax=Propionivibrio sp. TaxID=2212460 RepID=UPI0025CDA413|nr:GTPase Era [Propionivibrio sp.]MBK7356541.1 GTPase Era [Propionivibrio sp.]MBK8400955.1 GTPase Era [Propionivibrio sp.]MBK8745253.1 GTPase Era [Propionivibrio sp.]MBK8894240.1 GTPase Era [Propionivibrio sp.]MBL0207635.1 GTPase Era [Propionivibrio sp.]